MFVPGTSSNKLPAVLASGSTDVRKIFVSMSAREPSGRDADYLEWHSLDHRVEQHRLAGLRQSLRLVSTPRCRAARAASVGRHDAVDHVMTYFFTEDAAFDQFEHLSKALDGDRRPFRLPSVDSGYFSLVGKLAADRAAAGADVIPWRPSRGVYLLLEQGAASPEALTAASGVAGIWWHAGKSVPGADAPKQPGLQLSYLFLDEDPVDVAGRLRSLLDQRWSSEAVVPLLAAPFQTLVPFEWERFLP